MFIAQQIAEKRQVRAKIVAQARESMDVAQKAGRSGTEEERARWDAAEADVTKLDGEIRALEKDLDRQRRFAEMDGAREPEARQTQSKPEGAKAFSSWLLRGDRDLTAEQRSAMYEHCVGSYRETRGHQADDPVKGGYLLTPRQFVNLVIKNTNDATFMRSLCRVFPNVGAEGLGAPQLTSRFARAQRTSELSVGTEKSATFGKRELKPTDLSSYCDVSNKLLESNALDIDAFIAGELGYSFAIADEEDMLVGDGAGKPLGVFTASDHGIPTTRDTSVASVSFDSLIEVQYQIKAQYKPNSTWLGSRVFAKTVRKLKDGDGQYLWQASTQVGQPDTLLGRPIVESEFAPSTLGSGTYAAIIGDFRNYWIADSGQMRLQRLYEIAAMSNSVRFLARMADDGAPVVGEAFARLKIS